MCKVKYLKQKPLDEKESENYFLKKLRNKNLKTQDYINEYFIRVRLQYSSAKMFFNCMLFTNVACVCLYQSGTFQHIL